jgi:predicted dehydrogenase
VAQAADAPRAAQPSLAAPRTEGPPKVRIGIVGCGQMGRWHLDAYKRNTRVELVAFADSNIVAAARFAAETGGQAYASHREMLAHERLDGVSICTLPCTHREIAIDVMNAGAHVLCEKPLAMNAPEADVMCGEARDAERLILTAFKFRFFESVQKARELLQAKAFGTIVKVRLLFGGYIDMTESWYAHQHLSGGGVLIDNGAHAFDLIRYLFGEIASVAASTSSHQRIDVEDTATVTCMLAGGGIATLDMSWSLPLPPQYFLEIYGEQGTALLDGEGISYKLQGWPEWKRVQNTRTVHEAFDQQINHFVSAITGDAMRVVVPEDGWRSQVLIDAAYRSAERGSPVAVDSAATDRRDRHSDREPDTARAS